MIAVDSEDNPLLGEAHDDYELAILPPLPRPDFNALRVQVFNGIGIVIGSAALGEAAIHGLAWLASWQPATFWSCIIGVSHAQVMVVAVAHALLLLSDPGIIRRGRGSCLPIPPAVAERLRAGESLDGLVNVAEGDSSYCVRCCVWRRPARGTKTSFSRDDNYYCEMVGELCEPLQSAHHCSICNRCVAAHDHHCDYFGRCIAAANMKPFITVATMAPVAGLTTFVGIVATINALFGEVLCDQLPYACAVLRDARGFFSGHNTYYVEMSEST